MSEKVGAHDQSECCCVALCWGCHQGELQQQRDPAPSTTPQHNDNTEHTPQHSSTQSREQQLLFLRCEGKPIPLTPAKSRKLARPD
eukprot:scaffold1046_cov162-Ochromonas_danica.AAC.1